MAEKKVRTREKKERKGRKHESLKSWEYYEVKGDTLVRKRKNCPRCGPGTMLSQHKNRTYCGRCGFTEIQKGGDSVQKQPEKPVTEDPKPVEEKDEEQQNSEEEKKDEA